LPEGKKGIRNTLGFKIVINIELERKAANEECTVRMGRP